MPLKTEEISAPRPLATGSWLNLHEGVGRDRAADIPLVPGPFPTIPGYSILRELGRGGMGVVYRAEQQSLHRPVALKMILRGSYATTEERVRFLVEAEMLARVKHPNIVQVYEVGTHDGFPFLSLELVEGGTLHEFTAGKPQPAREAAALIAILADAVQAAHSQGIIHRDLKPSNVLLHRPGSENGAAARHEAPSLLRAEHDLYGMPKITDFGLAKRFEEDSRLTTTGHVLGTPSYMAPEQAMGLRDVGPAVDIYALGAVLYEMLTGVPPFRAATSIETLNKVIHDDPPPLDREGVAVPRDLAVICLKCLEKEPARRYKSAALLGDDLTRFLRDEPIAARPVSRRERLVRWCRRHPDKAILAAACVLIAVAGFCGVLWKWREAVAAQVKAEALLEEMTFALGDRQLQESLNIARERQPTQPTKEHLALMRYRVELYSRAVAHYQELLASKGNDPRTRFAMARARWRLAESVAIIDRNRRNQAQPAMTSEGEMEAAFSAAVGDLEQLASGPLERGDILHELASARQTWAAWLRSRDEMGSKVRARELLQLAVAAEQEALRPRATPERLQRLASIHRERYETLAAMGRSWQEQRQALDACAAIRQGLADEHPEDPELQSALGGAHRDLQWFCYLTGDCTASLEASERALRPLKFALARSKNPGVAQWCLFEVHELRAKCREHLGDADAALAAYDQAAGYVPPELRARLLSQHAYCAAHAGAVADAERLTNELLLIKPITNHVRYNMFCVYASCYQTTADDAEAERYAALAAHWLKEMDRLGLLGWPEPGKDRRGPGVAIELEESGLRHHPLFIGYRRQLDRAAAQSK